MPAIAARVDRFLSGIEGRIIATINARLDAGLDAIRDAMLDDGEAWKRGIDPDAD